MSDRTDVVPVQLMRIARGLSSGEVLVLLGSHQVFLAKAHKGDSPDQAPYGTTAHWVNFVTKEAGLAYPELVETFERPLMEKFLLSPRTLSDGSGFRKTEFYRLTSLGFRLCEFMREEREM